MKKISTDKSIQLWKTRSLLASDKYSKVLWPERPVWNEYVDKWQCEYLIPYLNKITKNDIVLDVGCGIGRWTYRIANKCLKVYGIDISEENIKTASEVNSYDNVFFKVMDVRSLEFYDNTFDYILSCTSICCNTDYDDFNKSMKELFRVTKQEGYILFLENTMSGENYVSLKHNEWFYIIEKSGGKIIKWQGLDIGTLRNLIVEVPFALFTRIFTRRGWELSKNVVERDQQIINLYNKMSERKKRVESFILKILVNLLKPFEFTIPHLIPHRKTKYVLIIAQKR